MAKILIAGIGGGKKKKGAGYNLADYYIDSNENLYENRTFITSALEEHYKIDKTIYIGTVGSMWDELYLHYVGELTLEDEEYIDELENSIIKANEKSNISEIDIERFNNKFNGKVEAIVTKFGVNETEIFENFNLIMRIGEMLNDGDEVYIDITHSFRSNAMWMFLIMNYVTDVLDKKISIEKITYGMFEAGKDIPLKDNRLKKRTPIINLKVFYDLMKWIKGANEFKNYGNSYNLLELIEDNKIKNNVKNFSDGLNLNYVGVIKQNIKTLYNLYNQIGEIEGPAKLIIPNVIKNFLEHFKKSEKDYEILLELASWYFVQKKYGMVAVNINECIRNFIIDVFELQRDAKNTGLNIKDHFFYSQRKLNSTRYKTELEKKEYRLCRILFKSQEIRNDVSHSLGERTDLNNDIKYLEESIEFLKDILYDKRFISYYENKYHNGLLKK
jgi:CRISPR-associated protein, TM1812 family